MSGANGAGGGRAPGGGEMERAGGARDARMAEAGESEVAQLRERLRQTEERLAGLQQMSQIAQLLSGGRDLERVLAEIGRRTAALMECERATLFLVSEDGRTLTTRVERADGGDALEIALPMGRGIAGWVAEHGRAVNVKDAYKDPRFDPRIDRETGFTTRSMLCQPLRDRHERPLGVVQALNKRAGYFTTADEALLETLASQAAIVIRSSRLIADLADKHHALLDTQVRLQERNSEIDLLFAIERAAALARDLDDALEGALAATSSEYPCDAAAVVLLDEPSHEGRARRWRVRRATGEHGARLEGLSGDWSEPILGAALREGRDVVLFDDPVLPEVPALLSTFSRIESLALIPLRWRAPEEARADGGAAGDDVLGAFVLVNSRRFPRGFDELDRHKLGVIASRMALSVTLSRALEEERKAERMAAIGGALSSIVHDLRTPLTLLDGYARLMAREAEAEARAELRDKHKAQIAVVNAMIHDVLAFARGQSQVLPRKVWARDFMSEIEEMLRIELAGSRVEARVEASYRGGVRMDEAKMKRVVTNLVRNAREAMGEAGGALTVSIAEDPGARGWVRLTVEDTGPGIPAEMEGRLFQSFSSYGKAHGTGLGLAIVKTIVDQHEGTLEVSSRPGIGTTFVIGLHAA